MLKGCARGKPPCDREPIAWETGQQGFGPKFNGLLFEGYEDVNEAEEGCQRQMLRLI